MPSSKLPLIRCEYVTVKGRSSEWKDVLSGVPQGSVLDLRYQNRLPSLAHRRRRGDMIQCFKIIKGLDDIPCDKFFTAAESRTRGHCYKLIKPRCETSFRLRSFSQRVITDWNKLPYDVVTAQTLNSFKNRLDKFWSNEDMYSY